MVGPEGVWLQDNTMLHATLFHASSHKASTFTHLRRSHDLNKAFQL